MPELAEVEYVARQLRDSVIGATIATVDVRLERIINHPSPADFAEMLLEQRIESIDRRAKLLIIYLTNELVLLVHRRMSGNLRLIAANDEEDRYSYVRINFTDGRALLYSDPRKFGHLALWRKEQLPDLLAHLGPEPLEPSFTPTQLATIVGKSGRAIKAVLLDQSAIAGLGNIYADEALYMAFIHPQRPANSLTTDEIERLHNAIRTVLTIGIEHGGTTFGRHQGLFGEAGTNLDHLKAYHHTGMPCERCGTIMQRIVVAQRGTHICPHCQT